MLPSPTSPLTIDGSHGEGGGQIVRSSLALSLLTGRPVRLVDVRGGRKKPGLAAQHLTAVRAAAAVGGGGTDSSGGESVEGAPATVEGDRLGSQEVTFTPGTPRAGEYAFDVAAAREGGSAGAATLVLQTVLLPLARGDGDSTVTVRGGTHMEWSPPFEYLATVWGPALATLGVEVDFELRRYGFYPVGQGEIRATVRGRGPDFRPASLRLEDRGPLQEVTGHAVAAELPAHIPQRMSDRARSLLDEELNRDGGGTGDSRPAGGSADGAGPAGGGDGPGAPGGDADPAGTAPVSPRIEPQRVRAACAGAALFLRARYAEARAGFTAHGRLGKASEAVAEEAAHLLLAFHRSGAPVDEHLADQFLLPLALADGPSSFVTEKATGHLTTQAWLVEQFGVARVRVEERRDGTARVTVEPGD